MSQKSKLNEYCQKHGLVSPVYNIYPFKGSPHDPIYHSGEIIVNKEETELGFAAINEGQSSVSQKLKVMNKEFKSKKDIENFLARKALYYLTTNNFNGDIEIDGDMEPLFTSSSLDLPRPSSPIPIPKKSNSLHMKKKMDENIKNIIEKSMEGKDENNEGNNNENKNIFLIDYDNMSHIEKNIKNLKGEVHLFISFSFNFDRLSVLINKEFLPKKKIVLPRIHRAYSPNREMVDHMMTWYACKNIKVLKRCKVYIVSRDAGLYSLAEILKHKKIDVEFINDINVLIKLSN